MEEEINDNKNKNDLKQQILVIHGGNAFDKYEEYIDYLKTKEVTIDTINRVDWKRNLALALGENYQVLSPQMPNSQNARYVEWKIWFDKLIKLVNNDVILVGHSLGGIFLAKYLSENVCPKKVKATLLVAAPFNTANQHPLVDFNIVNDLEIMATQGGKLVIFHSSDDFVVSYDNAVSYKNALPNAELITFTDRNHFLQPEFPELIAKIKSL